MILSKETMLDILDDGDAIVRDSIVDTGRWSIHHELIFKYEDKLYIAYYSVGATEQQDESPWEYDDTVSCIEVEPYEKTEIDYRVVGTSGE